jgi:hypothetical protein
VGRMVARKARRSRGQEPVQGSSSQSESARGVWLVYSTKPTPSRDDRGDQVMSGIGVEGAPSLQGLRRFTIKPSGSLVEPQSQYRWLRGRRRDTGVPRSFDAGGHVAG